MDDTLISALANIPFAVVLIYWIRLDFQQRRTNLRMMTEMMDKFIKALADCNKPEGLTEVNQEVNQG